VKQFLNAGSQPFSFTEITGADGSEFTPAAAGLLSVVAGGPPWFCRTAKYAVLISLGYDGLGHAPL